ncbi:hypothetical protein [Duganella sp. Root198D2]|uniref:hypothetical protein n=1 Tax=Duganella sp. Root198D2 TaxID=1736489 RepID=UPI00070EC466|nr:hypothetical protein [Duganella sp. Root198D2]
MAVKRTYSVRLEDDQRRLMEERAGHIGMPVGHLIRAAIDDFLRQQEEKDYLSDVQATIMAAMTRLSRQVEKDRAEQQLIMAFLDHFHDWLAFALPAPADRQAAEQLRLMRRESFVRDLPKKLVNKSRALLTQTMEDKHADPIYCPMCGTGHLRTKADKRDRPFWYCSNWNAPNDKCGATFPDDLGQPALSGGPCD